MFLGVGGSGKSSVFDGLMNKPLRTAESTPLADTLNIKYHWVEAADAAEDAWKRANEEDELKQLALMGRQIIANKEEGAGRGGKVQKMPLAPAEKIFQPNLANVAINLHDGATNPNYLQMATQFQNEITQKVVEIAQQEKGSHSDKSGEAIMHIWDCGGQQVFLDILSAFLTPRTIFIYVFNASKPLKSKYVESWRHKGQTYPGKEQVLTVLQLMMQWMQLIHVNLVVKKESTLTNEDSHDGIPESKPDFPRIIIVGTHGDQIESKEKELQVLKELKSSCIGKAFNEIILNRIIVDNTKAGKGEDEDPGYEEIRKEGSKFAKSLRVQTPIAWVSFRKVLQKFVDSTLSCNQIVPIAEECGISEKMVPSVLRFYHEMGVFLHYKSIKSLSKTVIIKPQWLIDQLCKLLMPGEYSHRPCNTENLWYYLEEYGILVEPLYCKLWGDCGLTGGAQAMVDLLDHFDLAKEITSVPRKVECHSGKKYFIPCILKNQPQEGIRKRVHVCKQAATLHITFTTEYVPPGFFVRLAAHLTESKICTPLFEGDTYRNCISFYYKEIDRVTISESLSGVSIQVDMMRVDKRTPEISHFTNSCLCFRNDLSKICIEVLCWLQSVEFEFAFKCNCSTTNVEHFAIINDKMHKSSHVSCCEAGVCEIKPEHKHWLQEAPLTLQLQDCVEDGYPEKNEISNIAKAIDGKDLRPLMEAMEIDSNTQKSKNPAYTIIFDYVMKWKGSRYTLARHLEEAEFNDASSDLLMGKFQSPSPHCPNIKKENLLQKHDTPTLEHLIHFPLGSNKFLNIIKIIAKEVDDLGIFLLSYEMTDTIKTRFNNDLVKTTKEVLHQWIQGKGKQPVTWKTFILVLRKIELSVVADQIEDSLN